MVWRRHDGGVGQPEKRAKLASFESSRPEMASGVAASPSALLVLRSEDGAGLCAASPEIKSHGEVVHSSSRFVEVETVVAVETVVEAGSSPGGRAGTLLDAGDDTLIPVLDTNATPPQRRQASAAAAPSERFTAGMALVKRAASRVRICSSDGAVAALVALAAAARAAFFSAFSLAFGQSL